MDDSRRCTATAKRSRERCKRAAIVGGTVCSFHGGKAPQVRQAAEVRAAKLAAHEQAERMVARAGVDADPVEHLLESLHRAAALVEVWGAMVATLDAAAEGEAADAGRIRGEIGWEREDGDELTIRPRDRLLVLNRDRLARVHPYYTEYRDALELRARLAKLCLDAGVAERQVRLAEEQAKVIADVITGVLDDLNIERKRAVMEAVARRLRRVTA
ncbi:MAG TPA: hypothetical protein VKA61_05345 [Sphingomicrobium sp.]|nr:hypothetical protein [Sphingomicrobium sp.]